mmetsp:Transcript_7878/g.6967  ORF Transcript_7878/g.6967 Transcript_7878/m.6967 type:complete len:91 (+) Transcript_7878:616-888(+)
MGLIQGFLKVVLGLTLLVLMKKTIHSYYHERKWKIIVVTLGTLIYFSFKGIYMQLFMDAKLDLTYMFNIIGSNQAVEINEFSMILSFLIA